MCYYQPNKPPCTCAFLQLIKPCDRSKRLPSPNNNPNPLIVVCDNKHLCRGVGQRYCARCCGRPLHPPLTSFGSQRMVRSPYVSPDPDCYREKKASGESSSTSWVKPKQRCLDLLYRDHKRSALASNRPLPPRSVTVDSPGRSTEVIVAVSTASASSGTSESVVARENPGEVESKEKITMHGLIHEIKMTAVHELDRGTSKSKVEA